MKRKTMITLALLSALGASSAAWAVDYPLPPANSRLIGQNQYWTVQEGDRNLQAIARHFDTAAMLILEANDTIAPVQPKPGTQVLIPSQMLLPDVPREGIVVNLAELRLYYFPPGEGDRNLQAIARHFDTAAMLILEANDTIAPVQPKPGTQVLIPSQMLLPDVPREGIVVNLAELRLYYFPPGENQVQVYPLGIGQLGLETPEMTTRVGQKIPNPTWTPTAGIRARSLEKGVTLPAVVPAGPNNPLGRYALRLAYGNGEYLIHGTNAPDSVGLRVSSGCMRMNADDIKALFSQVKTGTPVRIINQPVKFAVEPDGKRYVEVHRPLSQTEGENTRTIAYTLPAAFHAFAEDKAVDDLQLKKAMSRRAGYPVVVSAGAGSAATSLSAQNSSSDNGLLTQ